MLHYVGTLLADGSQFDSTRERTGSFKFVVGLEKGVLKGLDLGVATMLKGEKAELYCRADYAYGELGSSSKAPSALTLLYDGRTPITTAPDVPGGAAVKFEVELLGWAKVVKSTMTPAQKLTEARTLKANGAAAFKLGRFAEARDEYTRVIPLVKNVYAFTAAADRKEASELHIASALNAAQCALAR